MTILEKIIAHKREEVQLVKGELWKTYLDKENYISQLQKSEVSFYEALQSEEKVWPKLIAEVKKGSPSQGLIRADFNVAEIVKLYDQYAAAMSILTDEKFFLGSLENLRIARANTNKPLLRKDFIIDEFQIYEARKSGADAILLLASVLKTEQIQNFLDVTYALGMDALVEVHDQEELGSVLKTDAKIIGINNRNLKDFSIDLDNSNRLAKLIPENKVVVSESGINSKADIRKVAKSAEAVLVGTAITKSADMKSKIRDITGFPEVKICGITNYEDAKAAVVYGADCLGFIFYEKSPRNIEVSKCREIIEKLKEAPLACPEKTGRGQGVCDSFEVKDSEPAPHKRRQARKTKKLPTKLVGVFVNKKIDQVLGIVEECGLNVVQLHGEESWEEVEILKKAISHELGALSKENPLIGQGGFVSVEVLSKENIAKESNRQNIKVQVRDVEPATKIEVWKAFRIRNKGDLEKIKKYKNVDGILLDTFHEEVYGGTGEAFDWKILRDFYPDQKIILAGGLDASNVQNAINVFHPDVLDVSSKIEKSPGRKDLGKMRELFDKVGKVA